MPATNVVDYGPIIGSVPEPNPDLPQGTVIWVEAAGKFHSLYEIAQIARQRIASEGGPPPNTEQHTVITLWPQSKKSRVKIRVGAGVYTTMWEVVIDNNLKVTSCKKFLTVEERHRFPSDK